MREWHRATCGTIRGVRGVRGRIGTRDTGADRLPLTIDNWAGTR
jgi:hypothetical protein